MIVKKTIKLNLFPPTRQKAQILQDQFKEYHKVINQTLKQMPIDEKQAYAQARRNSTLPSKQVQKAVRFAIGIYKSARHNGRQPPKHVDRPLIRYDKDSMTVSKTEREHIVFAIATNSRHRLPLIVRPDGAHARYVKHIEDGWIQKGILLEWRGNNLFVYVMLTKQVVIPRPKRGQPILAVDVGSVNLVTAALFRNGKYQPLGHKGTENTILGTAREKSKRREQVIKAAKWVVNHARIHKAVIALEQLKNIKSGKGEKCKEANRKINRIPYAKLKHWIFHLAHLEGIPVRIVNGAYSSQLCFRCGYIDRNNRHNGKFCCKRCGYTEDADTVGAYNIATMAAMKLDLLTRRSGANLRVGYSKSVGALVTRPPKAGESSFKTIMPTPAKTPTGFSRSQGL